MSAKPARWQARRIAREFFNVASDQEADGVLTAALGCEYASWEMPLTEERLRRCLESCAALFRHTASA